MREKKVSLTKTFKLDSAHRLIDYKGVCENLHGHTYKLEVTVTAPIDTYGFVIDFSILGDIVKKDIVNKLDHQYFNEIFSFNPTCENVAMWIFDKLDEELPKNGVELEKITLYETATSFAVVTTK